MNHKLIIFDCDGVLVDTETLTAKVYVKMAAELGAVFTLDEVMRRFKGGTMAETVAALEEKIGRPTPTDFVSCFRAHIADVYKSELRAIDGIAAVLEQLNCPFCVASSGPAEKIRLTLGITGLLGHFEGRIFSCYDIQKWKPDPSIFLHAASRFGIHPTECAVIEDSLPGVKAGIAAGMKVFAFCGMDNEEEKAFEKLGAEVFHGMHELLNLLYPQRQA